MDFQTTIATLRSIAVPVTLYNFCHFSSPENLPPSVQTETDLQQLLEHKYEYTEESEILAGSNIFKKGLLAEIEKYFGFMSKICEGVYLGNFTTQTLINEYTIVLKVVE